MAKKKEPSAAKPDKPAKTTKAAKSTRSTKKATVGDAPLVDPNAAAAAAAKMLLARATGGLAPAATTPHKETTTFKQLKESIQKPHTPAVDDLLNSTTPTGAKRPMQSHDYRNQVGHNQTFGADVSRMSVPRRTSG